MNTGRHHMAEFFSTFCSEWHPAKDAGGGALYPFIIENLQDASLARPQCIQLGELLRATLDAEEPNLTPLRQLLLALVEDGQRHTMHGHGPPTRGSHPCARTHPHRPSEVICRYMFPKPLVDPTAAASGVVHEDSLRPGLYNLFLARNDSLINSFEAHLLLANLGNLDWRPLINLWSVLTYLTKYTAKSGKVLETSRDPI